MLERYTDEQLIRALSKADRQLWSERVSAPDRVNHVVIRTLQSLGVVVSIPSQAYNRLSHLSKTMYPGSALARPAAHVGVAYVFGLLSPIEVPLVFGTVLINPLDTVDLTEYQKYIVQNEEKEMYALLHSIRHVMDVGAVIQRFEGFTSFSDHQIKWFIDGALHLQAACSIVLHNYPQQAARQSALLSVEFILKSVLVRFGWSEGDLQRKVGHDFRKALLFCRDIDQEFPEKKILKIIQKMPKLVSDRYSMKEMKYDEVVSIVLAAQSVAAEIVRFQCKNTAFQIPR